MASRHLARTAKAGGLPGGVRRGDVRHATNRWCCTGSESCSTRHWRATGDSTSPFEDAMNGRRDHDRAPRHGARDQGVAAGPGLEMRCASCPDPVRVFTGDDYNYVDMIAGDGSHTSDALLGAFAAIGPVRVGGVRSPRRRRRDRFPRHPFADRAAEPAHLRRPDAVLQGRGRLAGVPERAQDHFRMLGGFETGRSLTHLADLVRAADGIGLFPDPDFTADAPPRTSRYTGSAEPVELSRCSLNSITVRGSPPRLVALAAEPDSAASGCGGTSTTAPTCRPPRSGSGLRVTSVCRGGMFRQPSDARRKRRRQPVRGRAGAHAAGRLLGAGLRGGVRRTSPRPARRSATASPD